MGNYLFQKNTYNQKTVFQKTAFFIVTSYPNLIKTQTETQLIHTQSNHNVRI